MEKRCSPGLSDKYGALDITTNSPKQERSAQKGVYLCATSPDSASSMVNQSTQAKSQFSDNMRNYSPISMASEDSYLPWSPPDVSTNSFPRHSPGGSRLIIPGSELAPIKIEEELDHSSDFMITHSPDVSRLTSSPMTSPRNSPQSIGESHVKKKVGGVAGKSIEEELCLICGDRASGYHYNALSCEGCKGFFRRSITRNATYQCKYGSNCEMDMWMRRRCQACRLRRCREVGMKEECLLSDDQCKARDVRRKARQRVTKTQAAVSSSKQVPVVEMQHSPDSNTSEKKEPAPSEDSAVNPLECVTEENRELIETLVYYQDKYELPSEDDVKKVSNVQVSDVGRPKEMSESIYKMVAEMTILTTQLVVEFAKHMPGFNSLNRDDQIVLLKGSASEVMVLRTARRYDLESRSVILGNGMPMSKETMKIMGLHDYVDNLFVFCHRMALLGVDNAEYSMITAISILTERPSLNDPKQIELLHDIYLNALVDYNRYRRTRGSNFLAKLLMMFTDLQTVSQIHADALYNLKLEKVSLPPLLAEYFDVMD